MNEKEFKKLLEQLDILDTIQCFVSGTTVIFILTVIAYFFFGANGVYLITKLGKWWFQLCVFFYFIELLDEFLEAMNIKIPDDIKYVIWLLVYLAIIIICA